MSGRGGTRIVGLIVLSLAAAGCSFLERSSVSSAPANTVGTAGSYGPSLSESGRYVAFTSAASNLVAGDTNGADDVFVRDNVAHTTRRVSVADDGRQADGRSGGADISDDGRYVAFFSDAINLVSGDGNRAADIFVRDLVAGTTVAASVGTSGALTGAWGLPTISGDGRTVAYTIATGFPDVVGSFSYGPIVRHLDTGTTTNLGTSPPLGAAATLPGPLSLSDDGRRVASIVYLLSGAEAIGDATVRDTTTGAVVGALGQVRVPIVTNRLVPITLSGDGESFALGFVPPPGRPTRGVIRVGKVAEPTSARTVASEFAVDVALSDDGARLGTRTHTAFGDVAMVADPMVGEFRLVSTNVPATNVVVIGAFALSGDGEWVAFDSTGTDVATGDTHGVPQVYTRAVAKSMDPPT